MKRELLEQPFAPEQTKERVGRFGQVVKYIEGHAVIQRLNDALDGQWSFWVKSHEVLESEVIVLGELIADGITKMQFGSSSITKTEAGGYVSIGTDLMSAATCSLKKCSSLMGVGLYLYAGKSHQPETDHSFPAPKDNDCNNDDVTRNSNSRRLSSRQNDYLISLAASRGLSAEEANEKVVSQLGLPIHMLTKQEASSVIQQMLN